jgi:hypothetical protein
MSSVSKEGFVWLYVFVVVVVISIAFDVFVAVDEAAGTVEFFVLVIVVIWR